MSEKKSLQQIIRAIGSIPSLNTMQKALLTMVAVDLGYNGVSEKIFSADDLAQMMSCCVRSVRKLSGQLSTMGYLIVKHRFDPEHGGQLPSFYSVTDKIFDNPKSTKKV